MPLIKARTHHVETVRYPARLLETNRDTLLRYARFIGDKPDYVLNQLIETTLAKDREFLTWRTEHPDDTWQDGPRRHRVPAERSARP
jgi:hypothetical protein